MNIEAVGLGKTYTSAGRPLAVLKRVDVSVPSETSIAIVGPSGSGKSTLLGLLAGLDEPTSGSVSLGGHDLLEFSEDERAVFRARYIGFVFQTFHLLPTLTALENVLIPLELQGAGRHLDRREANLRARDLLDRVGLADRGHHYPAQLSGGEQQRVAIARAFANRPKILFADEPTGNLDQETGAEIIDRLEALNKDERTTLALVTHDTALAQRTDRVVHLAGGRVVSSAGEGTA